MLTWCILVPLDSTSQAPVAARDKPKPKPMKSRVEKPKPPPKGTTKPSAKGAAKPKTKSAPKAKAKGAAKVKTAPKKRQAPSEPVDSKEDVSPVDVNGSGEDEVPECTMKRPAARFKKPAAAEASVKSEVSSKISNPYFYTNLNQWGIKVNGKQKISARLSVICFFR